MMESRIDVWKLLGDTLRPVTPPTSAAAAAAPATATTAAGAAAGLLLSPRVLHRLVTLLRTFGPTDPRIWQRPSLPLAPAAPKSTPSKSSGKSRSAMCSG